MGKITIDGRSYFVDLNEYHTEGAIGEQLLYGNIVRFQLEPGRIKAEFGIGIEIEHYVQPEYIGSIFADVIFQEGQFRLFNFQFSESHQTPLLSLPDVAKVSFQPVDLTKLEKAAWNDSTEFHSSIAFGMIDGHEVSILLIRQMGMDPFAEDMVVVVFY